MPKPSVRRRDFAATVRAEPCLVGVNCDNGREFSVGDPELAIRRAELDAVADSDGARFRTENLDASEVAGTILDDRAALDSDPEHVASPVRRLDGCVGARNDSQLGAATSETDHIADGVVASMCTLRSCQIEIGQGPQLEALACYLASVHQKIADDAVKFAALLDRWTHDQRGLSGAMRAQIVFSDRPVALGRLSYLADALLFRKHGDGLGKLASRRKLDGLAQLRITLAANHGERCGRHAGLPHLVKRAARFNRVMLAFVANEQDAFDSNLLGEMKQAIHLPSGEEARLVDDPNLSAPLFEFRVFEQVRHSAREHARLRERLDAAASRSEAAHEVAPLVRHLADSAHRGGLGCARGSFESALPIASRKRYFGGKRLIGRKAVACRPAFHLVGGGDRFNLPMAFAHKRDVVALQSRHLRRGKCSDRMPMTCCEIDKPSSAPVGVDCVAYAVEDGPAHRVL